MNDFADIPVLDLTPLIEGGDISALTSDFAKAYGETGFAYVINHGIDRGASEAVFAASRDFHALPEEAKQAIALNRAHRGYIAINTSTDVTTDLAEVTRPNQSASFMMMREDDRADPDVYLSGPNQWPELAGFRPACEAYADAMTGLGRRRRRWRWTPPATSTMRSSRPSTRPPSGFGFFIIRRSRHNRRMTSTARHRTVTSAA